MALPLTPAELRTIVRELTDTGLEELYPNASIDRLLAAVFNEVWSSESWPFASRLAELVLDETGRADLPADLRRLDTVRVVETSGARLLRQASDEPDWVQAAGCPGEYRLEPFGGANATGVLECWPASEVTVRIRYTCSPPDLVEGQPVPALPAEAHQLLAYGAAARLLASQADETKRGEAYQSEYESGVSLLRSQLMVGNTRPFVMGGRRGRRAYGIAGVGRGL